MGDCGFPIPVFLNILCFSNDQFDSGESHISNRIYGFVIGIGINDPSKVPAHAGEFDLSRLKSRWDEAFGFIRSDSWCRERRYSCCQSSREELPAILRKQFIHGILQRCVRWHGFVQKFGVHYSSDYLPNESRPSTLLCIHIPILNLSPDPPVDGFG